MEFNDYFRDYEANLLEEIEKEFQDHLEKFVDFDVATKNDLQIALCVATPILVRHIPFFHYVVCLDYLVAYD